MTGGRAPDNRAEASAGHDLEAGANADAVAFVGVLTGSQDRTTLEQGPATHIIPSAADLPQFIATLNHTRTPGQ